MQIEHANKKFIEAIVATDIEKEEKQVLIQVLVQVLIHVLIQVLIQISSQQHFIKVLIQVLIQVSSQQHQKGVEGNSGNIYGLVTAVLNKQDFEKAV